MMMKKLAIYIYWGYIALLSLGTTHASTPTTCREVAQEKAKALEKVIKYLKKEETLKSGRSAFDDEYCEGLFNACKDYAKKFSFGKKLGEDKSFLSAVMIVDPNDRKKFSHWLFNKILEDNSEGNKEKICSQLVDKDTWFIFEEKELSEVLEKELNELPGHLQPDYINESKKFIEKEENPPKEGAKGDEKKTDEETKELKERFFGVLNELAPRAEENARHFWKMLLDESMSIEKGEMILAKQVRRALGDKFLQHTFAPFDGKAFLQRGLITIVAIAIFYVLFSYGWLSLDLEEEY